MLVGVGLLCFRVFDDAGCTGFNKTYRLKECTQVDNLQADRNNKSNCTTYLYLVSAEILTFLMEWLHKTAYILLQISNSMRFWFKIKAAELDGTVIVFLS